MLRARSIRWMSPACSGCSRGGGFGHTRGISPSVRELSGQLPSREQLSRPTSFVPWVARWLRNGRPVLWVCWGRGHVFRAVVLLGQRRALYAGRRLLCRKLWRGHVQRKRDTHVLCDRRSVRRDRRLLQRYVYRWGLFDPVQQSRCGVHEQLRLLQQYLCQQRLFDAVCRSWFVLYDRYRLLLW